MDANRLRGLDLFSGLSKHELDDVARLVDEVDVPAGKVLGREGEIAYEFFVIEEGTASVDLEGEHVAELGPDQWFGEIGLLSADRRTATVTATTPMRLAVIFGPNFRDLTRRLPELGERIRAEIEERLARAS
jgi:CRP/FNR family transcriptional regulator, cyclic AMP receptor protein